MEERNKISVMFIGIKAGKTQLMRAIMNLNFEEAPLSTIGIDYAQNFMKI